MKRQRKKLTFIISAALIGTLTFGGVVSAQEAITTGSVNFRTAPTTSSTVVGVVPKGDNVDVIEEVNNYWSRVTYEYKGRTYTGYISNSYYQYLNDSNETTQENGQMAVTTGSVNFRTGPSTSYTRLGMIPKGDTVTILEKVNSYWSHAIYNYKGKDYYGYLSNSYYQLVDGQASTVAPATDSGSSTGTDSTNTNTESDVKEPWEAKADSIINTGLKYWGTDYRLGADYEDDGSYLFDCSSYTEQVYEENGINLYRSSRQQATQGTYVKRNELRKGDLLFYATQGDYVNGEPRIDHVAMVKEVKADGSIVMLHTYKKGIGVTTTTMYPTKGYWNDTFLFAKRVIQ